MSETLSSLASRPCLPARWLPTVLLLLSWFLPAAARAQSIQAEVRPARVRAGEAAIYSFIFKTPNQAKLDKLPEFVYDKLLAEFSQQFSNFSMVGGLISNEMRYDFRVTAATPGVYRIPPQTVVFQGKELRTNEVQLEIVEAQRIIADEADDPSLPTVTLEVGKREIWIGEAIPVEVRVLTPTSTIMRRVGQIELPRENFVVKRFPVQAEQDMIMLGSDMFQQMVYRSSLSALKEGTLTLGPAQIDCLLELPLARGQRLRSIYDNFEPVKKSLSSQAVTIKVKPLPAAGKPAGFAGAVGNFALNARADREDCNVGDPIGVEIAVTGTGNFESLAMPVPVQAEGWKLYPAKKQEPNRRRGYSPDVVFSQVIVPEKIHPAIPSFRLSFFEPESGQYKVLETSPIPLRIMAGAGLAVAAPLPGAALAEAPPPAKAPPAAEIQDILDILPAGPALGLQPLPFAQRWSFRLIHLVPMALLAVWGLAALFLAWRRRRARRMRTPEVMWRELKSAQARPADFYGRADEWINAVRLEHPGLEAPAGELREMLGGWQKYTFSGQESNAGPPPDFRKTMSLLQAWRHQAGRENPPVSAPAPLPSPVSLVVKGLLLAFLLQSSSPSSPAAQPPLRPDEEGAIAYREGRFADAEKSWLKLIDEKQLSPNLCYNLGNAAHRLDKHGEAALWYRRALLLQPRHREAAQNLEFLSKTHGLHRFPQQAADAWAAWWKPSEWLTGASVCLWLAVGSQIGLLVWKKSGPAHAWLIFAALIFTGGTLAGVAGYAWRDRTILKPQDLGIVTMREVLARTAATETSAKVIDLPAGSEVKTLRPAEFWCYIEIPGDHRGWVRSDQIAPLWPFAQAWLD